MVLPEPEGPTRATSWPGSAVKSTSVEGERDRGGHGRGCEGGGAASRPVDGPGLDRLGVSLAGLDRELHLRRPLGLGEAFLVEHRVVGPL